MLRDSGTVIAFGMSASDAEALGAVVDVAEPIRRALPKLGRGAGIAKVGRRSTLFDLELDDHARRITETDEAMCSS
jgi:hypothetical protein